jgi:hypothetical protein
MPDVGESSDTQTEIAPGRTYLQVIKGSKKTFSLFDQPQKGRTFLSARYSIRFWKIPKRRSSLESTTKSIATITVRVPRHKGKAKCVLTARFMDVVARVHRD